MIKQRSFTTSLLLFSMFAATAQKQEVFTIGGKAIRGYDAVAFFTDAKAVKGFDSLGYDYLSARWLFATTEHLEAFKANPEKYAPQYGGYCAYGTAEGHKAPTLPDTWSIVNNKLYFNYNQKVKQSWIKDTTGMIEKADRQWPLIKAQ